MRKQTLKTRRTVSCDLDRCAKTTVALQKLGRLSLASHKMCVKHLTDIATDKALAGEIIMKWKC